MSLPFSSHKILGNQDLSLEALPISKSVQQSKLFLQDNYREELVICYTIKQASIVLTKPHLPLICSDKIWCLFFTSKWRFQVVMSEAKSTRASVVQIFIPCWLFPCVESGTKRSMVMFTSHYVLFLIYSTLKSVIKDIMGHECSFSQ